VKRCPICEQRFSRDAAFCPFDGVKLAAVTVGSLTDPLVDTRIDSRYDVLRLIGEGGMGRIYEVRHVTLARAFAMKVLRRELAREEDLAERFIREATATASVKHPNVVQITDFGRLGDGTPYFVMDLLVGHTLGEVIKTGGPIPAGRAVRIIREIAAALGAAHAAGIVHRDLKPDNVFLVGGPRDPAAPDDPDVRRSLAMLGKGADVRVVDFGAAKIVGSSRVTRAGVVFGTPHYMSPEQASGRPVDHRADVYALGVIMYEMFCGRVPFEADTYMGVLTQHMFVDPIPPSQVCEAARDLGVLETITLSCLAKKPADRFASMDDLILAIDGVVQVPGDEEMRSKTRSASSQNRTPRSVRPRMADELEPPSVDEMSGAGARWRSAGRSRIYLAAIGGALMVAAVVAWLRLRGSARVLETPARAISAPANSVAAGAPVGPSREAAPAPSAVESSTLPVASVGEAASAPQRAPQRPRHPRASGSLDDVGDPFERAP
jgi:serine/threonine protein kinase